MWAGPLWSELIRFLAGEEVGLRAWQTLPIARHVVHVIWFRRFWIEWGIFMDAAIGLPLRV
jgi:hypothetical protein